MNRKQRRAQGKAAQPTVPGATAAAPDPAALHEAGVAAYGAGDLDRAAALIGQAIALNDRTPSFHYNLAIVLKASGRLEAAAASYERAIALRSDYAEAHNNLGNVFKALGRRKQALTCFEQALACRPDYAEAHYNLGVFFSETDEQGNAETHLQVCLAQDPDDFRGVRMLLAHQGCAAVPARTPHAQLIQLYDQRARSWDGERFYHGHELVARALRIHAKSKKPDILDAGCGTGLAGALVRDFAARLDGVDISRAMLEKAKAKQVYDDLHNDDLLTFISGHRNGYDAIISAATLIHFGDLRPVFEAAVRCLRGGGLFVFTLFCGETGKADFAVAAQFDLARNGCFAHSAGYVERLAKETGFLMESLENVVHERDRDGQPVAAILAVLRWDEAA